MNFNSRLIVLVAIMASLLEIIDVSIVNVAIPTMMGNLGCTLDEISIVITGYTVANAIILPIAAWLSQRFGLREYFLGCIALFTVASVACGLSPNLTMLVLFRILQGLAGGALLPTSQALIYQQFPKEKAGIAGAIFGMSVMIGPSLGPVLGGYLTDNFGWRSIFNVNLPVGILTLFVGFMCLHNPKKEDVVPKNKLDVWGLVFLVLGVGCLQFTLERGQSNDWFSSDLITATGIVSVISLALFIWWESRVKFPIINIFLFKQRTVVCGVIMMASLGFFLYGVVFLLPVFLQTMFHYTATQTGLIFIPGSLLTAFIMPFVGKNLNKVSDPRIFIFTGLIAVELTLYLMSCFSSLTSYESVLAMLFMRGFALAFLFVPINSLILSQYTGYEMGQVAGLLNLFRQIGGSVGIASIDTLFNRKLDFHYHVLIEKITLLNQNVVQEYRSQIQSLSRSLPSQLGFTDTGNGALKSLYNRVYNQSFVLSFLSCISIMILIFTLSFVALYFLRIRIKPTKAIDSH